MNRIDFVRVLELITLTTMLLSGLVTITAQQLPQSVAHPSALGAQVKPRTSPSPYGSAANAATGAKLPSGIDL